MTAADESPSAEGRSGARKRGRPATQPCGTRAGWRRHRYADEAPCDECVQALSDWNAEQYKRRAAQAPVLPPETIPDVSAPEVPETVPETTPPSAPPDSTPPATGPVPDTTPSTIPEETIP